MDENIDIPWWRTPLQVFGVGFGLLALAGLLMAFILFVARVLDGGGLSSVSYTPPPAPLEQNARTRIPTPYELVPWPSSPARGAAVGNRGGGGGGGGGGSAQPAENVAVGVSIDEYRATIESGGKVFLPDPQGECDVSGADTAKSSAALEKCFAAQAAR